MSTSTRRQFLKTTGLLGSGLGMISLLPKNLLAGTSSFGLPYYKPGAPFTENLYRDQGDKMMLSGVVYQHDGKTPLIDAVIEIWHCDKIGHFDFSDQFVYRGKTSTDKNGRYTIHTLFPGRYTENGLTKMSRIFMLVTGYGHKDSFSQLYFDRQKNPFIDNSHWAACPLGERPSLPKRRNLGNQTLISYDHFLDKHPLLFVPDAKAVAESQLRIYPNYLQKESYVAFGKSQPGHVTVRLWNAKKHVEQKLIFKNVKRGENLPIDHQKLPAGLYTCSIYSSRLGAFSRKLKIG